MLKYDEKVKNLQKEGIPVTSKIIRKALCNVLRQHADVATEGETTSSVGSDRAPSEDNLDKEDLAKFMPNENGLPDPVPVQKPQNTLPPQAPKPEKIEAGSKNNSQSPIKRSMTRGVPRPKTNTQPL